MGSWDNATYIQCPDENVQLKAISEVISVFGFRRAPTPPGDEVSALVEHNWGDDVLKSAHIFIGVRRMDDDWVRLHCYPHYLLCADIAEDMLLERLCRKLKRPALHINVYDGHALTVIGVNERGEATFSGGTYDSADVLWEKYGDKMDEMLTNIELPFHGTTRVFKSIEPSFDFPETFQGFDYQYDCEGVFENLDSIFFGAASAPYFHFSMEESRAELDNLWYFKKQP